MKLSAEEILSIAIRAENNAAGFYRQAAKMFPDASEKFMSIAEMEEGHKMVFQKIQDNLESEDRSEKSPDPFYELQMYLDAVADMHGGEGRPTEFDNLKGDEKISEVISRAVELEKKSILFYAGIESETAYRGAKEMLGKIIDEEKKHVAALHGLYLQYKREEKL